MNIKWIKYFRPFAYAAIEDGEYLIDNQITDNINAVETDEYPTCTGGVQSAVGSSVDSLSNDEDAQPSSAALGSPTAMKSKKDKKPINGEKSAGAKKQAGDKNHGSK